jgi:hypothetical protein
MNVILERIVNPARRLVGSSAATLAFLSTLLLGVPQASAHDTSQVVWRGSPPVMFVVARGRVFQGHRMVEACDTNADGDGVRTWYVTSNGHTDFVGDANGSAAGCGRESPADGGTVVRFKVCAGAIGHEQCSGWTPA